MHIKDALEILESDVQHGYPVSDLTAVRTVLAHLKEVEVTTADLLEILGETAWGVQLPALFVSGPVMQSDGTIGANPIPTVLHPEAAKQLVEHVYQRVKTEKRRWLEKERRKVSALEREVAALRAAQKPE